jgi:NAD(P)-dependent dehydrogenase (short-subunit alcohol dehydrogenase family)
VDLLNKAALITGGKRIGVVVGRELAARGVDVAFSYARSKAEAEQAAAIVVAAGRRSAVLQADLSQPAACAALVDAAAAALGRLNILINMASNYAKHPETLTVADWNAALDVDLRAAFLCAHAAVRRTCAARAAAAS